ncbi:MAG TPA: response regulator transcription factor [Thermohalobaculum sp.]|nr:response regulator transcription factor [Thermohalobaculum sp.]
MTEDSKPEKIRIVIVDDHPIYRDGVALTLSESDEFEVAGEGASADEAVALAEQLKPDIALLDISMPGGGISAVARVRAASPATKVAMLTVSEAEEVVMDALRAGATGYILKGISADELTNTLREIAAGRPYVSPALAARLLAALRAPKEAKPRDALRQLNHREANILRLVSQGLSNKEVARALDLQEKTVKHYMTGILQKLNARNRVEATVIARNAWDAERT